MQYTRSSTRLPGRTELGVVVYGPLMACRRSHASRACCCARCRRLISVSIEVAASMLARTGFRFCGEYPVEMLRMPTR